MRRPRPRRTTPREERLPRSGDPRPPRLRRSRSPPSPSPYPRRAREEGLPVPGGEGLGPRRVKGQEGPPPLLEGQVVGAGGSAPVPEEPSPGSAEEDAGRGPSQTTARTPRGWLSRLRGLGRGSAHRRAGSSRRRRRGGRGGVRGRRSWGMRTPGRWTSGRWVFPRMARPHSLPDQLLQGCGDRRPPRALVEEFGAGLFDVLHEEPERLRIDDPGRPDGPASGRHGGPILAGGWSASGLGKEPQEEKPFGRQPRPRSRTRRGVSEEGAPGRSRSRPRSVRAEVPLLSPRGTMEPGRASRPLLPSGERAPRPGRGALSPSRPTPDPRRGFLSSPHRNGGPGASGCYLRSTLGGSAVAGVIVETEAYIGPEDPASHAATREGRTNGTPACSVPRVGPMSTEATGCTGA